MEKPQGKIPIIRFPEFTNVWEQLYFGDLVFKTDKKNKENHNLPVFSINNTAGFVPQDEQFEGRNSKERGFDISIYKIIGNKTFAYNPARINVGSIGYSYDLENVLISSLYVCFKTKENLDDIFLLHYLNTNSFRVSVLRIQEGGVRQYLFFENLAKIRIFAPSISEQTRIASFFTVLDKKIAELRQKKNLLEQYKKGIMQKLFSQELRFKDENGKEFPKWEKKTLGKVATFFDEKRVPISEIERQTKKGNYPYYGASGIIDYVDDYLFDGEYILLGEDGANILNRTTELAFIVSGKFWVNNHAHVMQAIGNNRFLAESLERINYEPYNTGTVQPKLNAAVCKSIPIEIPCLEEQTKIANFLSVIDDKINRTENQIQQTQEYKKGLLQKMFC
jgi:type I restriction enzyme S subunit